MHIPTAIFASTALAVLALIIGALTLRGTALAWIFCIVISCSDGLPAFVVLAAVFILTAAASRLAGKRADPYNVRRKSGARDIDRVFCNVGVAALAGSMCIGLLWLVSSRCGRGEAALVAAVGFLGCTFDSVLGSRAQMRYRCTCCGKITELDEHCGAACIKEKGIVWMNNDIVNLLNNVFALTLALAVYAVML